MAKKIINKDKQNNFLELSLSDKIELLNNTIRDNGTEDISKELGFSYSWVKGIMEQQGVFYVQSIRKFIIEEKNHVLTDREISIIKSIIEDYTQFKSDKNDIRLLSGTCGDITTTRSMVIDSKINEEWNEFCKTYSYISPRDFITSALILLMNKYKK